MTDPWRLIYDNFDPQQEPLREALCTLGNGYFALRGAAEESRADEVHYPGTYLAGGYNRLSSEVAGHTVSNEDLVNWPNALVLNVRPKNGDWLNLMAGDIIEYRQTLDLNQGILQRCLHVRDHHDRETLLQSERFVSMRHPPLAAIRCRIVPLNWSGELEIYSGIDGSVINSGVERYRALNSKHLHVLDRGRCGQEEMLFLVAETCQSHIRAAQVIRTMIYTDNAEISVGRELREDEESIGEILQLTIEQNQSLTVEKIISFVSTRLPAVGNCLEKAQRQLDRVQNFDEELDAHRRAWAQLWDRYDIDLNHSDADLQLQLRLHIFHLLQTVSMNTVGIDAGVPARGLHGEAYRGHIFWDSLFILPFFNLRIPQISRSLLMYRFHRLEEARSNARENGRRGAQFPWQSATTGGEETQQLHLNPKSGQWDPDYSHLQFHVGLAIAYDIWQYYQATGDDDFMNVYGAEMFLEISHFWAGLCQYDAEEDRYHISGVVGPDEYHEKYPDAEEPGLRDNAYSNVLAAWVLERALSVLELRTPERRASLLERLDISESDIQEWEKISRRLTVPIMENGVIEQFAGYGELEELDWNGYREKYGDIQRLDRILKAERSNPDHYKVSKQADVLMLLYLFSEEQLIQMLNRLGYDLDAVALERTIHYYRQRTSHGSTLSHVVHASALYHYDPDAAWQEFCAVMSSDIMDIQGGTTSEGIHLGAMGGGIEILLRHYAGVRIQDDGLSIAPSLPRQLKLLRLKVRYRGPLYTLDITPNGFSLSIDTLRVQPLLVDGEQVSLTPCTNMQIVAGSQVLIPNNGSRYHSARADEDPGQAMGSSGKVKHRRRTKSVPRASHFT